MSQEYRKEYYKKNRKRLLEKENCIYCGKKVSKSAMRNHHLKNSNCLRVQEMKKQNEEEEINEENNEKMNMKNMIIILTKIITNEYLELSIQQIALLINLTTKLLESYVIKED